MNGTAPLRRALLANAVFSLATGALMASAPGLVGRWIGVGVAWPLRVLGVALVGFAALLVFAAGSPRRRAPLALLATFGDFGWVAATIGLFALAPHTLSSPGWVIAWAVAAVVLACGVGQAAGLRRMYLCPGPRSGGWQRLCFEADAPADAHDLWRVLRDAGRIHEFSPNLRESGCAADERGEADAVRVCRDHAGRSWSERLRFNDEALELEAEFDPAEPGFPFPFRGMRGGWSVRPAGASSGIRMWLDVVPRRALPGWVTIPLMEWAFARTFRVIAGNMAAEAAGTTGASPAQSGALPVRLC